MSFTPPERIYPESIEPSSVDRQILRTIDGESTWDDEAASGSSDPLMFTFASPATTWTATHNLGTFGVVVEAFDAGGVLMDVELEYVDVNTVAVHLFYPSTGFLRIFE